MAPKSRSFLVRFWEKINVGGPDECWLWTGAKTRKGYGLIGRDGRLYRSNRVVLEMKLGRSLHDGEQACHTCDNPTCCNPSHLWPGTNSQNQLDAVSKGRHAMQIPGARAKVSASLRGELHPQAKLSNQEVDYARQRCAAGSSQSEVARELGVAPNTVNQYVRGRRRI